MGVLDEIGDELARSGWIATGTEENDLDYLLNTHHIVDVVKGGSSVRVRLLGNNEVVLNNITVRQIATIILRTVK
jgi:hypothetical protein